MQSGQIVLFALGLIATAALAVAVASRKPWLQLFVGALLWIMIAYILLFYSGSVARNVLRPGPPSGGAVDGFYLGVQLLQSALFNSYLMVLYLAFLSLVNLIWRGKVARSAPLIERT
jgi:energy-coupling factor transporter transmembrane protein EcfT